MMQVYSKKILVLVVLMAVPFLLPAQQDISVRLTINNKEKLRVYHDQPLIVSIYISNPQASANEQWNREASLANVQSGRKEIKVYTIGSDARPAWQMVKFHCAKENKDISIPMKFLSGAVSPASFVVDANAYYILQWGIDRQAMQKLAPGKYYIHVALDAYHSKTVELEIRSPAIPASTLGTEVMQAELARFAMLYGQADTAMTHAKKILKINPSSIDGLVLLGEANIQKKNYREALRNFEAALNNFNKQFPHSPEPPAYIEEMILWLKQQ